MSPDERKVVRAIEKKAEAAANRALKTLRSSVPVRTGRMKAGCKRVARLSVQEVYSDVSYAKYVSGYRRAIGKARTQAKRALRGGIKNLSVEIDGQQVKVSVAYSRGWKVQGGRNKVVIRPARFVELRFNSRGRAVAVTRF